MSYRIQQNLMPTDISEILRRSVSDLFAPLELVGRFDSDMIYFDTIRGRELSYENLDTFAKTFEDSIGRYLATIAARPSFPDSERSLSNFCALALTVPDLNRLENVSIRYSIGNPDGWKRRTTIGELCKGKVLQSIYPGPTLQVDYSRYAL